MGCHNLTLVRVAYGGEPGLETTDQRAVAMGQGAAVTALRAIKWDKEQHDGPQLEGP